MQENVHKLYLTDIHLSDMLKVAKNVIYKLDTHLKTQKNQHVKL